MIRIPRYNDTREDSEHSVEVFCCCTGWNRPLVSVLGKRCGQILSPVDNDVWVPRVSKNGPVYMSLPNPMIWVSSEDTSGRLWLRIGRKDGRGTGAATLRL